MVAERGEPSENGDGLLMRQLVLAHLRQEGLTAAGQGRPEYAVACLRQALTLDDRDADLWAALGSVSEGAQVRRACARRALALDPTHPQAHRLLEALSSPVPSSPDPLRLPRPALRSSRPSRPRRADPDRGNGRLVPPPRPATVAPVGSLATPGLPVARPLPREKPAPQISPRAMARFAATLLLLLLLLVNAALVNAYERRYQGRFFPGVQIGGVEIAGLTRAEAEALLREQVAPVLSQGIVLSYGEQSWTFTAAQIGLHYRIEQACDAAWSLGRDSWWERERIAWQKADVPLVAEVRGDHLQVVVEQVAAALERPAISPTVLWAEDHWEVHSGQDGRHLLREDLEADLLYVLSALAHGRRPPAGMLVAVDIPTLTETATLSPEVRAGLEAQLEQVGRPLTLREGEHTWTVSPAEIAAWTQVEVDANGTAQVTFDRQAIRDSLAPLAMTVARPVERPRVEVDENGRVTLFQVGQPGRRLDLGQAADRVLDALQERLAGRPADLVDLPTEVIPPGDDALMGELGVVELVGEGTSAFVGSSPARANNILIGGQELHGRLIAPGEVFSFNQAIDPVTWEKGYQLSPIIMDGGVTMGLGGGLCQVATTFYRAALYSGLEIVERHPHLWRVDWYEQDAPPGFDATIAIAGPDLKVRNTTDHYLLIQVETRLDEGRQTVRFYGTSPGWTVTIDQLNISNGGHDVSYVRTITAADGTVLRQETFYSHYR